MPIPKRRGTRSSRNQRRSHYALKKLILAKCSKCNEIIKPHRICPKCGNYKGKQILEIKDKKDRKSKDNKKNVKDSKKKEKGK